MGLKLIISIILGIVMFTIFSSNVTPSIVSKTKILKVENKLIETQNIIFEAIKRYMIVTQTIPENIQNLIDANFLLEKHNKKEATVQ